MIPQDSILRDHARTLITVDLTHNILPIYVPSVRFSLKDKIIDLKQILEKRFGTKASMMILNLLNENKELICQMDNDYQDLGHYQARSGNIIQCVDDDPQSIIRQLNDESIQKYVMSDQDYDKLDNTVRKYKKMLQKNNPELFKKKEENQINTQEMLDESLEGIHINDRV